MHPVSIIFPRSSLWGGGYTLSTWVPSGYTISTPHDSNGTTAATLTGAATTTADIGFVGPGILFGQVFLDDNGDGQFSADEGSLPGATVTLYDENSNQIGVPVVTGADGRFAFTEMLPGHYTVVFSVPNPYFMENSGATTWTGAVTISSTEMAHLNAPASQYKITGTTWLDEDGDGTQETGESGLSGVLVSLIQDGAVIASAITDAAGRYAFSGLSPNTYTVNFVPPAGDNLLSPAGGASSVTLGLANIRAAINAAVDAPRIQLSEKPTVDGAKITGAGTFSLGSATFNSITLFVFSADRGRVWSGKIETKPADNKWTLTMPNVPQGDYTVYAVLTVTIDGQERRYGTQVYLLIRRLSGLFVQWDGER